jgi:LacI family transcriptional regulator
MYLPSVLPDDDAIAVMAVDYLISLGFRQLAYCWSGSSQYGRLRLEGFRRRAGESGIKVHECNAATTRLDNWLQGLPKPIGVLGCNDDWAHRLLNAARQQSIKVPDELAVLGVDNDELFNALVTPSLSSIALPTEQIGYEAASQLDRLMNGDKLESPVTLLPPVRVVPRASTDVLSIEDEDIILAVRFIREHASEPLQVDDVLDHVPLSRRSLERRFQGSSGEHRSGNVAGCDCVGVHDRHPAWDRVSQGSGAVSHRISQAHTSYETFQYLTPFQHVYANKPD